MKTIQLEIEDSSLDMFLSLINSLKDGIIKNFKIEEDDSFYETQMYFQKCLEEIDNSETELLSSQEYREEMHIFLEDLKAKYANY